MPSGVHGACDLFHFTMDNKKIQLIGSPCGHHGPYTFYKAFKYQKNGKYKILSLSDFFFVKLWSDSDLMSIGELILLWLDKNSEQVLASLRLYFLPENTPEGRNDDHGEDEVLAISEKVVLRADDLLGWITEEVRWPHGAAAMWDRACSGAAADDSLQVAPSLLADTTLDLEDIQKEKSMLGEPDPQEACVVVLSFARYCRYRGIMKRLEGVSNKWLHNALVLALGGFTAPSANTRVLFCKDTFDYPDLEGHEQLCNHLAPNLKGRPRKKPKKRSVSPGGSESNESESSLSTVSSSLKIKHQETSHNGLRYNRLAQPKKINIRVSPKEKEFLTKLHSFMKSRRTPICRVPHLGFKELDLYAFFTKVQHLGGYAHVTANRLWKTIYDELGGHHGSTSAATYTRRHYERLLLPYERSTRSEKLKPSKVKVPPVATVAASATEEESSPEPTPDFRMEFMKTMGRCPRRKEMNSEEKASSLCNEGIKSEVLSSDSSVPSDKENIPETPNLLHGPPVESSNIKRPPSDGSSRGLEEPSSTPSLTTEPESESDGTNGAKPLPNSDVEVSSTGIGKTTVPAFKKRKLEILKEGGLEVTAISSLNESISGHSLKSEARPSVIHSTAVPMPAADHQVSITVTPDVSHLLGSPCGEGAFTPSPVPPLVSSPASATTTPALDDHELKQEEFNQGPATPSGCSLDDWSPHKVLRPRSMYAYSERVVYGNPKDVPEPQACVVRELLPVAGVALSEEVLDLRVRTIENPSLKLDSFRATDIAASSIATPVSLDVSRNVLCKTHPTRNISGASALENLSNSTSVSSSFPLLGGRSFVGSNLEITVVDTPRALPVNATKGCSIYQPHAAAMLKQPAHAQTAVSRKATRSKPHPNPFLPRNGMVKAPPVPAPCAARLSGRGASSSSAPSSAPLVIPNPYLTSSRSNSASRARSTACVPSHNAGQNHPVASPCPSPSQQHAQLPTSAHNAMLPSVGHATSALFPGFLPPMSAGSNGSKTGGNPFLSLIDPLYLSSLYGPPSLYPPTLAPGLVTPLAPTLFPPSSEQLALYKELLSQQHSGLRLPPLSASAAAAVGFLGFLRDGSTSITALGPTNSPGSNAE